ncbi:MAG: condensation domain-containing protein [Pyrinomonadaceae bacterium]
MKRGEFPSRVAGLSPAKQELLERRRRGKPPSVSRNAPAPTIRRADRGRELPLTLLLEHQVGQLWAAPGDHDVCARCYRLRGALDEEAMRRAVNELACRHEILRTTFPLVEGRVTQAIASSMTVTMPVCDLRQTPEAERMEGALRIATEEARRPYDPGREPLWRVALVRFDENNHLLLLNISHIISDGWSLDLFVHDLWTLYQAFSAGEPSPLPELPIQFADYASWQRETLQGQTLEKLTSYWERQLDGLKLIPEIRLPIERPLQPEAARELLYIHGAFQCLRIPAALLESLKELSRREGVTLYILLLAALASLLHRYTGEEDFGIPTSVAKRYLPETTQVIGPFADRLVLRIKFDSGDTFSELLRRVRKVVLEAYEHQDLPFIMFHGNTTEAWDMMNYPSVRFNMQKRSDVCGVVGAEAGTEVRVAGLTISPIDLPQCAGEDQPWDLPGIEVDVQYNDKEMLVTLVYERERYEAAAAEELLRNYLAILDGAVARYDQKLSEFPLAIRTAV